MSSCLAITFLTGINLSLMDNLAPVGSQYSGGLAEVTKITAVVADNMVQGLYIQ